MARRTRPTTPSPPLDIAKALPQFAKLAKTTVRLHPRSGKPRVDASKIGGVFVWPQSEPWPTCDEHDCPYVSAIQLRKDDVPEVGFRRGADLFQVLWCPNNHDEGWCPAVRVYWRSSKGTTNRVRKHPQPTTAESWYLPEQCALYPERVTEYPDPFEFTEVESEQVRDCQALTDLLANMKITPIGNFHLPSDESEVYQAWLSTADGTKVGGYPNWVQDPQYLDCTCGEPMDFVMAFSSWEFDGVTWGRWLPTSDRKSLSGTPPERAEVNCPADWMFGDAGCMYLFICRHCEDWPVRAFMQCS